MAVDLRSPDCDISSCSCQFSLLARTGLLSIVVPVLRADIGTSEGQVARYLARREVCPSLL